MHIILAESNICEDYNKRHYQTVAKSLIKVRATNTFDQPQKDSVI
jgi:hypothetical protein